MTTNILIVEDEGLIALDLKKKLEQAGYTVPAIDDNAADALVSVGRLRPSLVLMDIRLHGQRDGIEAADQIRRRFRVPVMFVTAHADRETLERARITEPFGYIVKPFHAVDFRAQIEMALWKHKMEQKLRASEAWLSTTFQNVADALIATDGEGNIAFMNAPAEKLTGWGLTEAKGKPFLDVFQVFEETTGFPVIHPLEAIYDGRELDAGPRTFKLFTRGGSYPVLVDAELSANRDEGLLLGIIVVFRDVTARRNAEDHDRQLQKMCALALLATGLGRQLAVSQKLMDASLAQLIAEAQDSHALRLLGNIHECAADQQSVVRQLIGLGGTDAGPAVTMDLNHVLMEMEGKFRKGLGAGRSLNLTLQPAIPPIKADCEGLKENLLRLVSEARHAMPDGGVLEISTKTVGSSKHKLGVQVAVRDTGKGIRANAKERVFDPYYQSRPGNRNPGLSLSLVYQFAALNGGCIEVENSQGKGVVYLLNFPAAETSPIPPKIGAHRLAAVGESRKRAAH